jgi:hypothetical protein
MLIDTELSEPHEMVIVVGAAIGLRYTKKHVTCDLDSVTSTSDRKLWAAVRRACKAMQEAEGLAKAPTVSTSAVFDPPEDWESRQVTLRLGLENLIVRVPERHDLAISKVSRGLGRDYAALKAMHEVKPLRLKTLVERYDEARRVRVGDPWRFKENFLVLVATLFGDDAADKLEPRLKRD